MKKTILLFAIAIVLFSCGNQKSMVLQSGNYTIESQCPETGTCTFTAHKDSSLVYKKSTLGKLYYETVAREGKTVLKYNYSKKTNPALQDDFYREEIIIETGSDLAKLDKDSDIKMLLGVSCYCKGLAGFYEVEDGYAEYKDGKILITVPKVIDNQLTHTIMVNVK